MLPLHQGRVLCRRSAEAVGLEPTTAEPRPVFKTGSSSSRMTSVSFVEQAAGAGIEPTSRRSERPVLPLNDPASVSSADTHRSRQVRRQGSGGRNRTCGLVIQSHASHTNSDDPGMKLASRVPGGNRTRLSSLEGWCLCQSAKGTCRRKGRESNPQGREARPASNGVPSPVGLPFRKAAVAGIEPATWRLTGARPYQHRPHRNQVSQDGRI